MLNAIIRAALQQRLILVVVAFVLVGFGINATRHLSVDAFPDVTNVQVQIATEAPGKSPEEVERFVTIPIENQMNGIPQRTSIRSISLFGLSQITITFEDDANVDFVRNQAAQYLAAVTLPPSALTSSASTSMPGLVTRMRFPPRLFASIRSAGWVITASVKSSFTLLVMQ